MIMNYLLFLIILFIGIIITVNGDCSLPCNPVSCEFGCGILSDIIYGALEVNKN
uniref:Uncharacterized protein n=1 Tax=Meloidogyne enterolobii TaxID=390850 RepID=A0A6V7UDS8_MELEN|nr:unnamed protein product [Meloidogyne enterolobii]